MLSVLVHVFLIYSLFLLCLYLFYTFFIAGIPAYNQSRVRGTVKARLIRSMQQKELYFVLVLPCLNEERVIRNTLQELMQLSYKNLLIVVVDDASDDRTAELVREVCNSNIRLLQRQLPNARKGKGEALNEVYRKIYRAALKLKLPLEQVIVGVLDADGRPSLNLLQEALEAFSDPSVGAAQSGIQINNCRRLLPFMQNLEFSVTVSAMQNSREYLGSVCLGGNGQFARLSALSDLGNVPWNSCLVEDFDLGLRLHLQGWKVHYLSEAFMQQQGVETFRAFIRQRSRWIQGNMQCTRYAKQIRKANLDVRTKVDLLYILFQPWLTLFGLPVQLAGWIAILFWVHFARGAIEYTSMNSLAVVIDLLVWIVVVFSPGAIWVSRYFHFSKEKNPRRYWSAILYYPFYNLLMIPSGWLALWRHLTKKRTWTKTERALEPLVSAVPATGISLDELSNLNLDKA